MAGVAQLDTVFEGVEIQVDRSGRPAGDDQAIVTGKTELGSPVVAQVGLVPDAGQGRLATERSTAAGGGKSAGQQAVENQQRTGRIQRVE